MSLRSSWRWSTYVAVAWLAHCSSINGTGEFMSQLWSLVPGSNLRPTHQLHSFHGKHSRNLLDKQKHSSSYRKVSQRSDRMKTFLINCLSNFSATLCTFVCFAIGSSRDVKCYAITCWTKASRELQSRACWLRTVQRSIATFQLILCHVPAFLELCLRNQQQKDRGELFSIAERSEIKNR